MVPSLKNKQAPGLQELGINHLPREAGGLSLPTDHLTAKEIQLIAEKRSELSQQDPSERTKLAEMHGNTAAVSMLAVVTLSMMRTALAIEKKNERNWAHLNSQ